MDYLTKIYKEECKKEFCALGFKTCRNNFYRVINDVFQSFCLHKSVSGVDCTIEFSVVPLCMGNVINKSYCGATHLKMFEGNYSWFSYDRNDIKSIDNCVDLMLEYMKKYLIPHFDNSDNSKKAYFLTCDFQQRNYKNGIMLSDYALFCMALKSGFYEKSIEHLKAQKRQTEYAIVRNNNCFGMQIDKIDKIRRIDYQIKMIAQPDLNYIDAFISENEKNALSNLKG